MAWNHIANLKGPKGADGVGGVGSSAWADITGKPLLLQARGWSYAVVPGRWSSINVLGHTGVWNAVSGSFDCPIQTAASLRHSLPRWSHTSSAAAPACTDGLASNARCWRGDTAGRGGFVHVMRGSVTSVVANQRGFFGLHSYGGAFGQNESVYSSARILALAFDAAIDSNWQIIHGNGGAPTKVNLGSNFPINDPSAVLDVTLSCAPNASTIEWSVQNRNSGATASGTISTNMPGGGDMLFSRTYMSNGGTAAAVSCDIGFIYASSYQ